MALAINGHGCFPTSSDMRGVVVLRKVPYRLPGTKRIVWAVIVGESRSFSLLFVRKPGQDHEHSLAITMENVPERVFESVEAGQFFVEPDELEKIGMNLQAIADGLASEEFDRKFFRGDEWWKD